MFDAVLAVLVSTMVLGSLYVLLASGLSIIWSTLGVFNYAHGAMLLIGGYVIWMLTQIGLPVILAFAVALPVAGVAGILLELVAVRPLLRRPNGTLLVMVSTLAVASAVQGAAQLIWGSSNRKIPAISDASFKVGNVAVAVASIFALVLALALVLGLIFLLNRTEWGSSILAVEQNRKMALLVGIRPQRVYATVFAISSMLACAAALVYATNSTITPSKGFEPLLTAFVVLVFGGSASLWGTLIGAFVIGAVQATSAYALGLQWSPVAVFVVLVLVMLIRPQGLVKGRVA